MEKIRQYEEVKEDLRANPKTWLVTGVAGFIGSNLLEALLKLNQVVIGLDNFSTGHRHNLNEVRELVSEAQWAQFSFHQGDILDRECCRRAVVGVDYVLHQAALGSVPRSIEDPIATNAANIDGFLNMLVAAKDQGVASFTYAASSSTYGDHPDLPKVESKIGQPLSPYAVTKYVNELYASVFSETYGFKSIGLRYFNVFGARQDPNGAYAAVIPKWAASMIRNEPVYINGDGETSRDFCFVDNAVQANLLSAVAESHAKGQVYNVACNARTSLNQLFQKIREELDALGIAGTRCPEYMAFRAGDVRHSQADINKAIKFLGYAPSHSVSEGLGEAMPWYANSPLLK